MKNIFRNKSISIRRQEEITGHIFIIPFTVGFILFQLFPFISSFIISMTNLSFISNLSQVKFIGFQNFISLITDDSVLHALGRSAYYSLLFVPSILIMGLIMALLINMQIYARNAIRTAIFMPYVSNIVAIAVIWSLLFEVKDGPINMALRTIGIENPPLWLVGVNTVIPTIVIIVVWQNLGLFMITYLAALQGIPEDLYEAATIDGAGSFMKFKHITLPMISPTTFFLIITATISSLQNFGAIQVLTKGGPGEASYTLSINIYQETFTNYRIGYATAQAIVMFAIVLIITAIQWRGQKKWVNYI